MRVWGVGLPLICTISVLCLRDVLVPFEFFQLWPVAHSCRYRLSIRRKGIYLSSFLHHQWIRCRKKTHGRGCSVMLSLTDQFVFKMGPHVQLILDKFPKRRYVVLFWNLSWISVAENVIQFYFLILLMLVAFQPRKEKFQRSRKFIAVSAVSNSRKYNDCNVIFICYRGLLYSVHYWKWSV